MARTLDAEQLLREALLTSANSELESWLAAIRPLPLHEVLHSLLSSLPDFSDERLGKASLPAIRLPGRLPWVPLPPAQKAAASSPTCSQAADMLLPAAWARLSTWIHAQVDDLTHIQTQLKGGVPPELISAEGRPQPIAIWQDEFVEWA